MRPRQAKASDDSKSVVRGFAVPLRRERTSTTIEATKKTEYSASQGAKTAGELGSIHICKDKGGSN